MLLAADKSKQDKQDLFSMNKKRLSAPDLENLSPIIRPKGDKKHHEKKDRSWYHTLGRKFKVGNLLPRNSSTASLSMDNGYVFIRQVFIMGMFYHPIQTKI